MCDLVQLIMEGKSNYEILEENPELISQLERIDKVRQIIQEEFYSLEDYLYGFHILTTEQLKFLPFRKEEK